LYTIDQVLKGLKDVGFEIVEYEDLADPANRLASAQDPWYITLKGTYSLSFDQIHRWRMNPTGRMYYLI
jgi:sterol 24-C-methyltransferase